MAGAKVRNKRKQRPSRLEFLSLGSDQESPRTQNTIIFKEDSGGEL